MGETTGGVLRRGSDRIVGGVSSGLASYFGVDVLLVRIVFVILALIPPGIGIGIILYLALWFLMEPPQGAPTSRDIGARLRSMGDDIREDFRTGFRSQAGGGATPPPPSGAAPGSPPPPGTPGPPPSHGGWWGPAHGDRPRGLWLGIILIAIGAYLLIDNLGLLRGFRWDIFGSVVLIAVGLLILVRRR